MSDRVRVFHPFGDEGPRMSTEEREKITEWLMDTGLLWAVNKFFFHPLGVALTVEVRAREGEKNYGQPMTPEEEAGLGYMWLWPSSDGWEFEPETDADGRKKFEAFISTINSRDVSRLLNAVPSLRPAATEVAADYTERVARGLES